MYLSYNSELAAIDILADNLNVFKELETRDDAVNALIRILENCKIDFSDEYASAHYDGQNMTLHTFNFIELYLASGRLPGVFEQENSRILSSISVKSYDLKSERKDACSWFSLSKDILLNEVVSSGRMLYKDEILNLYSKIKNQSIIQTKSSYSGLPITIYTLGGKAVTAYLYNDRSFTTSEAAVAEFIFNHPNAVIKGAPSSSYNCHSYAWHMSDLYLSHSAVETCWIYSGGNEYADNDSNISNYWTNDYYAQVFDLDQAEKIYYSNGDHSAVWNSNTQKCTSKWGEMFLVEHDLYDCDASYDLSEIKYYAHITPQTPDPSPDPTPGPTIQLLQIIGNTSVQIDYTNQYYVRNMYDADNLVWTCTNTVTGSTYGIHLSVDSYGTASLRFDQSGNYTLLVEYFVDGEVAQSGQLGIRVR